MVLKMEFERLKLC